MRGLVPEAHYAKNLGPGRGLGSEKEMLWTECVPPKSNPQDDGIKRQGLWWWLNPPEWDQCTQNRPQKALCENAVRKQHLETGNRALDRY